MTSNEIEDLRDPSNLQYDLAKKIRELLDGAAKDYGEAQWEADGVEAAILDLVTEGR